jgi:uncharacterized membrane protein YeaQ/YmgE (transglycosylase-associated protein family)
MGQREQVGDDCQRFIHWPRALNFTNQSFRYKDIASAAGQPRWNCILSNALLFSLGRKTMDLSNENLLVILLVGVVAGWLAGQVMRGSGFGLIGDLIVGLLGAFIGDWLLPRLNIHLGVGIVALVINAFIGAIVLLLILRLVRGGGWRYRRW